MPVNIEGNVSQISAGNNWFQNVKAGSQQEKAAPQPKADDAVKVSISQEGIENCRKQLHESGLNGGRQSHCKSGQR